MDNAPILDPDTGHVTSGLSPRELDSVRARRAGLRQASATVRRTVEIFSADAAATDPSGALRTAVLDLRAVWSRHSSETESPEGVLQQVVADAPRLAPAVARLRAEHLSVTQALDTVVQRLAVVDRGTSVEASELTTVLDAVDRHRAAGKTLLYQAYQVDVGLGE